VLTHRPPAAPVPHTTFAGDLTEAIEAARSAGVAVVHVRHEEPGSDEWFVPGTRGAETHPTVGPADGEPVIVKNHPNSFLETDLAKRLAELRAERVAFCGMMTSMCVDATVRAAADRGLDAVLLETACAAPDLEHQGRTIPADDVHAAFCAALADGIADVVDVDRFAADPTKA
jgi:nicotinamidase-related amidase